MENNESDNTIKEILEEDRSQTRKRKRGKGCFLRLLIIAVILFIGFYGFILFRQKMLDLEADAYLRAYQTLTVQADNSEPALMEATQATMNSASSTEVPSQ